MRKMDLFEFNEQKQKEASDARAEKGIQESSENAGEDWKAYAIDYVEDYLRKNPTLFVDDVWNSGLEQPVSCRGFGAVIKYAAKAGWMVEQRWMGLILAKPSVNSSGGLKPVWKSLIYKS